MNNNIDNLDLITAEHHNSVVKQSLLECFYILYKRGIVGYCKEKHTYFVKEENG